jgi:hypothetical protein
LCGSGILGCHNYPVERTERGVCLRSTLPFSISFLFAIPGTVRTGTRPRSSRCRQNRLGVWSRADVTLLDGPAKGLSKCAPLSYKIWSSKSVNLTGENVSISARKWPILRQHGRPQCAESIHAKIRHFLTRFRKWDAIQEQSTILAIAEAAEHLKRFDYTFKHP